MLSYAALRLSSNQLSSLTIGVAGLALVADFLVAGILTYPDES